MLIDFSSCFALFLVLDEIGVASTNEDEEASPVALAIGYSITAAGFVFFFGPTTVVSLYSRAADKYTSGPQRALFAVCGTALALGLLYLVVLFALLAGGADVYCDGLLGSGYTCEGQGINGVCNQGTCVSCGDGTPDGDTCVCNGNYVGLYCELDCGCGVGGVQTNITGARAARSCDGGLCTCQDSKFFGQQCSYDSVPTFLVTSGECTTTNAGVCFRSPNYPKLYDDNGKCTIAVSVSGAAGGAISTTFETEHKYDYVTIGDHQYDGDGGLLARGNSGVAVTDGEVIKWASDATVEAHGFEICGVERGA